MDDYRDYWFRAAEQDWPTGLALLQTLGMLDDEGNMTQECALWVPDMKMLIGTGEYVTDSETGEQVELQEPLTDGEGNVYIHGNLATRVDLIARAEAMAAEHPELAAALSDLPRFVVTKDGQPVRPNNPMCVRAG